MDNKVPKIPTCALMAPTFKLSKFSLMQQDLGISPSGMKSLEDVMKDPNILGEEKKLIVSI